MFTWNYESYSVRRYDILKLFQWRLISLNEAHSLQNKGIRFVWLKTFVCFNTRQSRIQRKKNKWLTQWYQFVGLLPHVISLTSILKNAIWPPAYFMMTSSNGNIFRVTGHLCGEFTGPGEFPAQRPVTRSFDVFFDLRPNRRLSKQWWGWWFNKPLHPLWRHGNVNMSDSAMNSPPGQSILPPNQHCRLRRVNEDHYQTNNYQRQFSNRA